MRVIMISMLCVLLALSETPAQQDPAGAAQLGASQIIEKSLLAFHYQGDDMQAKVTMKLIAQDGGTRTRVLTMLRRDESEGGNQKYFMYFHEPGDVRGMAFMTWKYPEREDDRWVFVPAVDLVRRIAADDKYSSFVGSDFSYEDVSGRDVGEDDHTLLREEQWQGRDCYVIQSQPRGKGAWARRISWIDKQNLEFNYEVQLSLKREGKLV